MYKILLVEDDAGIAKEIADYAAGWGLEVHIVKNFEKVMEEFAAVQPHLVLLDISLPYFDGYYWCSQIRKVSKIPVIFLSSAADNMNILMAVNMVLTTLSRSRLTETSLSRSSRRCSEEAMTLQRR